MANLGTVILVGAGPGDPELLTLRAARCLAEADAVVYDRLVSEGVLALARKDALRVPVGKEPGHHPVPQYKINARLVELAQQGLRVVRLKGGDPFTFGRGSEEAEHLIRHGIAVEVVPGITSASGCAAAAGIPLTHRGLASGVRYVTGHGREDGALDHDWTGLADPHTTLVIYMGLGQIERIAWQLIAGGLPASTPAAAIARGTLPNQQICLATLATLGARAKTLAGHGPVLFIIGRVVALAGQQQQAEAADAAVA